MLLNEYPRGLLAKKFSEYTTKDARLARVAESTREAFNKSGLTAHNWEHSYRDALNAIVIGEAEGADMNIVLPAALMHDIGFLYGGTGKTHGAVGADKLPEFLAQYDIKYPEKDLLHIAACIRTHKGSMQNESPETLEAKVVCDADFLEKFGIFGVYSGIRTHTEFNNDIECIIDRKTKGMEKLYLETKTGKEIAEQGRQFVVDFFQALDKANEPYRT